MDWKISSQNLGAKNKTVIFSSKYICEKIQISVEKIVLQGSTITFAPKSVALVIIVDKKLNLRAQFERCTRKT